MALFCVLNVPCRYSLDQVIGVLLVTGGVIWATLDNASSQVSVSCTQFLFFYSLFLLCYLKREEGNTTEFFTGILLLTIAMVLSAGMGLFQEVTYKKYGKQWREGLFYTVSQEVWTSVVRTDIFLL